jgi:hypothetical protein
MFSLEYLRRTSLLNGKEKLMGNISSTISNIDKMSLNKIAARWPAKAVAQFYFY